MGVEWGWLVGGRVAGAERVVERGAPDEEEEVMGSLELIEEVEGVRLW